MSTSKAKASDALKGEVITRIEEGWDDVANTVLVQADGKIVLAGTTSKISDDDSIAPSELALARYNTDGTLDTTFGKGGKVTTDIGGSTGAVLQPDGKIVVCGWSYDPSIDGPEFTTIRYNTDGTLDKTFGGNGFVSTHLDKEYGAVAYDVARQADGKLLVSGLTELIRYNANGSLDKTFGKNGILARRTEDGFYNDGESVTVQPDGKIILAGYGANVKGPTGLVLIRYNADGTLDKTFGKNGHVLTQMDPATDSAQQVTLQKDGKIVVCSVDLRAGYSNDEGFTILRYKADGTLDTTFGKGGKAIVQLGAYDDRSFTLAVQSDGKIVLGGSSSNGIVEDFALVRLDAKGALDTGFGSGGKVVTSVGVFEDTGLSLAIQTDGKILLGGSSSNGFDQDFALVRYNADGSLDETFGDARPAIPLSATETDGYVVTLPDHTYLGEGKFMWSVAGGPDAALFKIDTKTYDTFTAHRLVFKAAPDFEMPKDQGRDNVYDVTLKVTDGKQTVTETVRITVKDIEGGGVKNGTNKADVLVGSADNDTLRGRGGDDRLIGGLGNDRLDGGLGNDILNGGKERDTFIFSTTLDGNTNVDTITNFGHRKNTIELRADVFAGLKAGVLEDFRFKEVKYGTQKEGVDKSDRILYDKDSGELYFDQDGSRHKYAPIKFAEVKAYADIAHDDFLIV